MGIFDGFSERDGFLGGNSKILFFILVFLLLFNGGFGFGNNCDCKE